MRRFFLWLAVGIPLIAGAAPLDTLRVSRTECEAIFLRENLSLVAERLQISQAEAMLLQAKLWPNPSFTVDQVNLWATQAQTGGNEIIPRLGPIRKNTEFGVGLEQLILTAGKRRKLMAIEEVNIDKAKQFFEDLVRNLKYEFRNELTQLQYLQFSRGIYINQLSSVNRLTLAYQRQVTQGNVARGEFIRLRALELEIAKKINEVNQQVNESQRDLKTLMHLPATTFLEITPDGYNRDRSLIAALSVTELVETARASRSDLKLASLDVASIQKQYAYERALRTPNLTFKSAYDRAGNAMPNFVGFGIGLDLPVFNRNQGNVHYARIGTQRAETLLRQKTLSVENELILAYDNLLHAVQFADRIEPEYEATLDDLLTAYTKNFASRDISLLEYLDFMQAYLENKKIILESEKDVNERVEELNYAAGTEVLK